MSASRPGFRSFFILSRVIVLWLVVACLSWGLPVLLAPAAAQAQWADTEGKAATATGVSAPGTSEEGQQITLSATVTSPGVTPTGGTVTFSDNGSAISPAIALANGGASFSASFPAGTHVITASYSGSAYFLASTSSSVQLLTKPRGALTIVVTSSGKDGTFSFTAIPSLGGVASFQITTSGGSASRAFQSLIDGSYTVTLGNLPFGYKLTSSSCGGAPQPERAAAQPGNSVTVIIGPGVSVTCTFTIHFDAQGIKNTTAAAIKSFMQHRTDTITSSQPQQTRGDGRLTGSLFGGQGSDDGESAALRPSFSGGGAGLGTGPGLIGPASAQRQASIAALRPDSRDLDGTIQNPLQLSGSGETGNGMVSASISLNAIRQGAAQLDAVKAQAVDSGVGYAAGPGGAGKGAQPLAFDIWAELQSNVYASRIGEKRDGSTELAYVGADYLISRAMLIGVATQFDWSREMAAMAGTGANGTGWMAGPYAAIKIAPQVTFDARAAWGQSTNSVNPFGFFEDKFNTNRELVSARLSGNWKYGAWRFSPEASFIYFEETQKAFTDQFGVLIPSQKMSLGRVSFGPEIGYRIKEFDGSSYEPYLGLKGVWDFSRQDEVTIDGTPVAPETLRGRVEGGVVINTPNGLSVRASAAYDGVGAKGYDAYQGRMYVRMPLN